MAKQSKKSVLLKNTIMLYILTFCGYLFNFITVPYQTRLLGPEIYGILAFAQACMIYVQAFLDFGFLLSSTEDVSIHQDDGQELSRILSAVLQCKLLLGAIALAVILVVCFAVPTFTEHMLLYVLYFLAAFINSLLPDFLYRGLEQMSVLTYRAVSVKLFFTLAIFVLLRNAQQYYIIPLLTAVGAAGACLWTYADAYRRLNIRLVKVDRDYVMATLKRSSSYFWSRIATTVYGATNSVVIRFLYPVGDTMGLYSSAEKLMSTARSVFSPVADSLYPYMTKNRDYKLVKKVLLVLMPFVILGCTVVGIFAQEFCVLIFGEEFRASGDILRLLLPIVAISLPTYVFGYPMLTPLGCAKYANISVIVGAVLHAVQLIALYALDSLTVENVCIATCITEFTILIFRVSVVIRNRNKLTTD